MHDNVRARFAIRRGRLPKAATFWVRLLDPRVERAAVERVRRKEPGEGPSERCCCGPHKHRHRGAQLAPNAALGQLQGRRIFRAAGGDALVLDVPMVGGRLTPVVLGTSVPAGTAPDEYEVVLFEQDDVGRQVGAFSLMVVVE